MIIHRNNEIIKLPVKVGEVKHNGQIQGFLGIRSEVSNWPENWLRLEHKNPIEAIIPAFQQTKSLMAPLLF